MSQRASKSQKSSQQTKPKRSFNFISDDEESDEDVQTSQKGKKLKSSNLDKQEEDKLVGDLMRYAVFMDHSKQPIKREEITKQILKDHKNITSHIIALAQNKFKEVLGFEMLEVPSKNAKKGGSGIYILRNISKENNFLLDAAQDSAEMGLLIIILSLILTNNNVLDQEQLVAQLKRLGLRQGEKHPVFDDWEKLIDTKFVKQLYLERRKGSGNAEGRVLYEYRFGPRANAEIDKKDILRWVAQVYGESVDETALKALDIEEEESSDSESSSESDESSNDNASQRPASQAPQKATLSQRRKKS